MPKHTLTLWAYQFSVCLIRVFRRHIGTSEMMQHRLLMHVGTPAVGTRLEEKKVAAITYRAYVDTVDEAVSPYVAEAQQLVMEEIALLCLYGLLSGKP